MERAFYSTKDDFSELDIKCNLFINYHEYAIYFDSTNLKDQGTVEIGAGNRFLTDQTHVNHQLRYNGNAMTYHCDPSFSFELDNADFTATTYTAEADGECETVSDRMAVTNTIETFEKVGPLLGCRPNPVSDKVTFFYQLPTGVSGNIRVTDIVGKEVTRYHVSADSRLHEADVSAWNGGVYLYSMIVDNKITATGKLIITK